MSSAQSFVLVNESTGAMVTTPVLEQLANAIELGLNGEFSEEWGGSFMVRVDSLGNVGASETAVNVRDVSDDPNAAAYHATTPTGAPIIYCFLEGSSSLLSGDNAFSAYVDHEIKETIGDPGCNCWADDGQGTEFAWELCDTVESFWYPGADGVSLSDFVRRPFFTPGSSGPYSYMRKPTAPFLTAAGDGGNYQLKRAVDESGVVQVTADGYLHISRWKKKAHHTSRTYRRGVHLSVNLRDMGSDPVHPLVFPRRIKRP